MPLSRRIWTASIRLETSRLMREAPVSIWDTSLTCSPSSLPLIISARAELYRSEEHTSELQSLRHLVCRLLLEYTTESRDRRPLGARVLALVSTAVRCHPA